MVRLVIVFLLSVGLLMSGCLPKLDITPEKVEAEILSALKPGDNSEAIESYLQKRGLAYSYDRFANRYQAIIRHPESDFHTITIHTLLDPAKHFKGVEANNSYTFL